MRQRILSALLALAMLLALIPAYALAAAQTGSSHNFSSDWRCDADNHWHFCKDSDCDEVSDKAAHSWDEGQIIGEPTYDKTGLKIYTCAVCGQITEEAIPKLEHNFSLNWSCDADNHWHFCTDPDYTSLRGDEAPHEWSKGQIVVEPTYDKDGLRIYACAVCKLTMEEVIPRLEHNFSLNWSCDADNHWHFCTDPDYTSLRGDEAPHEWSKGQIVVEPTYDKDGLRIYACAVCGQTMEEVIPRLEHNFSLNWSCDADNHWHICMDADCTAVSEKAAHVYDEDEDADCNICGYTRTTAPPARGFIVTFDANGGAVHTASLTTGEDGRLASLPTPVRSGYTFNGWYTALSDGAQVTTNTVFTGDAMVYALWSQNPSGSGGSSGNTGSSGGGTSSNPTPPGSSGLDVATSAGSTTGKPAASISGGTAVVSVSTAMGGEIVKQAVDNGSTYITITPDGITSGVDKVEVAIPASTAAQIGSRTNASLIISTPLADVSIPNSALYGLSNAGGAVAVTTEKSGNAVTVAVTANGSSITSVDGGITLTVPTSDSAGPGTVAILIHEDGVRETVRKSVAGSGSITIPLDGPATVEIVDNSKPFADVPAGSWMADAVAFVSAHELFQGTGGNLFSPSLPMSRGMLAVVLHNLESNPHQPLSADFSDVGSETWYAEGVAWAAANGIVVGCGSGRFGPGDSITREQLAVMLWRYTGKPEAANQTPNFADADQASSWAVDALLWAAEAGILNGKGNGILDPAGSATRAETAQMLKNFMEAGFTRS